MIAPNDVTFDGLSPVLTISQRGIVVADGVPVNDAARVVLDVIDGHIKQMFAAKDAEIARLRTALEKQETE
jgi:hypothetical protein